MQFDLEILAGKNNVAIARSNAAFPRIGAQLDAISVSGLRGDRRLQGIGTNFKDNLFGLGQLSSFLKQMQRSF